MNPFINASQQARINRQGALRSGGRAGLAGAALVGGLAPQFLPQGVLSDTIATAFEGGIAGALIGGPLGAVLGGVTGCHQILKHLVY